MGGIPNSGTYTLNILKLAGVNSSGTGGYSVTRSNNSQYYNMATYTLGNGFNTIDSNASVTFSTDTTQYTYGFLGIITGSNPYYGQTLITIQYQNGTSISFHVSNSLVYTSNSGNYVIVQASENSNPSGIDHDWYILSSDPNSLQLSSKTISHYFNPTSAYASGDQFLLGQTQFTQNNPSTPSGYFTPCYLSGTLIHTPEGDVPIENLNVGDEIHTLEQGEKVTRSITWVGTKEICVTNNAYSDVAQKAVKIHKDAIESNVPSKDLYITPEHCIFIKGNFIPIRLLINNISISYVHDLLSYTIYHIATEPHSIIWANNLTSESFLNSSEEHHNLFLNSGPASHDQTWNKDAAAPLATHEEITKELFNTLYSRAQKLFPNTPELKDKPTTSECNFRLSTSQGVHLQLLHKHRNWYSFSIPQGTKDVWIESRHSRPCDIIGPYLDDRRDIGVLIQDIALFVNNRDIPLDLSDLQNPENGWYPEPSTLPCWTNGHALLTLPNIPSWEKAVLSIKFKQNTTYLLSRTFQTSEENHFLINTRGT